MTISELSTLPVTEVSLHSIARFGKGVGQSDYSWFTGKDLIPTQLHGIAEALAAATEIERFFSLVVSQAGNIWLLRSYQHGRDHAGRASFGVDVSEVITPAQLPREFWYGLAFAGVMPTIREQIPTNTTATIPLPIQKEGWEVDPDVLTQARLGLPLAVPLRTGIELLKQPFWRYQGICYVWLENVENRFPWNSLFAPYITVNMTEPVWSEADNHLYQLVQQHPPTSTEWAELDRLPLEDLPEVLTWALTGADPAPVQSLENPRAAWLFAFRKEQGTIPLTNLLEVLQKDFSGQLLPAVWLSELCPGLSDKTRSFLALSLAHPPQQPVPLEFLTELARCGCLSGNVLPLACWANAAQDHPEIADCAQRWLIEQGLSISSARFVLDLPEVEKICHDQAQDFAQAATFAQGLGITAPRRRLQAWLGSCTDHEAFAQWETVAQIYQGWGGIMLALIKQGVMPPVESFSREEIALGVLHQQRWVRPYALVEMLAAFLNASRAQEGRDLLADAEGLAIPGLSQAGFQAIWAHWGGIPAPPPPLDELTRLADLKLVGPEDILPAPEDLPALLSYTQIWPRTRSLGAILTLKPGPYIQLPQSVPSTWQPALRAALSPAHVHLWLTQVLPEQHSEIRQWVASIHELNVNLLQAFCEAQDYPYVQTELVRHLAWCKVFTSGLPQAQRVAILICVGRSPGSVTQNRWATTLVKTLLPDLSERAIGFTAYALTRQGKCPAAEQLPVGLLIGLLAFLSPNEIIESLLVGYDAVLSANPDLIAALVKAIGTKQLPPPQQTFAEMQRCRHLPLIYQLAQLPGWQSFSPDPMEQTYYLMDRLKEINLEFDTFVACVSKIREPNVTSLEQPQ